MITTVCHDSLVSAIILRLGSHASSVETSILIVDCMGSFLSVRAVDQQRKQLLVEFYSRWYVMRSGVGVSARQIRLAMKRVVEQ